MYLNKNGNIHKNEIQDIRWSGEYWQVYRLAANITEYHIISKSILQRIIITNFCGSESHLTYGRPGIDYRVASLFTRYPTAIGIIPESLKSIGQF